LRIDPAGVGDGGQYDVVVRGYPGGVEVVSDAVVVEVVEPVQVVQQPRGGQVCEGQPLVLEVVARGGEQYQWEKDGQVIAGATLARYEKASAEAGDEGRYVCVVSNACGLVRTEEAVVEVVELPRIVQDVPSVVQVQVGQPLVLEVVATGEGLQYQWMRDGQAIAGATLARYEKASAEAGDAGTYWCWVWNGCDTVESGRVRVEVVVGVAEVVGGEWVGVRPQPVVGGVMEVWYRVEGEGEVVVRDVVGREVRRMRVMGFGRGVVEVGGSGVYVVQLERAGQVKGQQVVVVVR